MICMKVAISLGLALTVVSQWAQAQSTESTAHLQKTVVELLDSDASDLCSKTDLVDACPDLLSIESFSDAEVKNQDFLDELAKAQLSPVERTYVEQTVCDRGGGGDL
jgi:hypothetical protein